MNKRWSGLVSLLLALVLVLTLCVPGAVAVEEPAPEDDAPQAEEPAAMSAVPYITYVAVVQPELTAPDSQSILVGFAGETMPDAASLTLRRETDGTLREVSAELDGESALFTIDHTAAQSGSYALEALCYTAEGEEYTVILSDIGIDARYGVNVSVETQPDDVVVDAAAPEGVPEITVSAIDEDGTLTQVDSIEEALEQAEDAAGVTSPTVRTTTAGETAVHTTTSSSTKPVVVVLDPGHDNVHGGATSTIGGVTYREEQLTLKIALYCRDELQKYAGVRVYMTRTTADCPHPGTTSGNDNLARVHDAAALGADYYVSIHLNSATASAKGVEIYYPNANYATLASGNEAVDEDENVSADGKALSQAILNQLVKLGLSNRGVKVNTASATYPDGSKNDAYQVIRESKLYGFPGIIVEHCFITNPTEVGKFLSTDAQLRTLGEADALGIATYLGLKKGGSTDSDTLKITLPEGYGEEVVYLDGVACYGTVTGGVFSSTPDAEDARTAVMYRYNDQGVPAGMYVWSLTTTNGKYTATPVPELEDLLLYHGFSIRITGDSGIRCKTSVSDALKQQLTGKGVNGYTLKSYGTLILPKSLAKYTPLVLGADKVNVATAYDKASGLDNVFETKDGRDRFTAVLTKIPANQYKTELSFRGYITLTKDGQDVTIYGPIVQRSIYALAKTILESNTYPSGSATDTFLKKLISDADAQS